MADWIELASEHKLPVILVALGAICILSFFFDEIGSFRPRAETRRWLVALGAILIGAGITFGWVSNRDQVESPPSATSTTEPATFPDTDLSKQLELPGQNYQTLDYRAVTSVSGKTYQHGLFLDSQDRSPSSVTYRIPRGAQSFSVAVIARDAGGCGSGDVNGWDVLLTTPAGEKRSERMSWNYPNEQMLAIPLDTIPPNKPRELTITVNPYSDRPCDHPALGDPRFSSAQLREQ